MLVKGKDAEDILDGSLSIIDDWLNARQKIMVLFCEIAGVSGDSGQLTHRQLPDQIKVNQYCGLILDYTSKGHFEIYEQIIGHCTADDEENLKLAQELYSCLKRSTDLVLNFNDKYAETATDTVLKNFDADLSELGEVMESRFKCEDKLLKVVDLYHTVN